MENNIIEQGIVEKTTLDSKNGNESIACDKSVKPMGYAEFLGVLLLFAIPVIGWIACLICMFAPKKKVLKNYARAVVTWFIMKIIMAVLVVLLAINLFSSSVLPMINDSLGTQFSDIRQVVEVISDISSGNYAGVLSVMKPQLTEMLGAEFEPIINELSKDEYSDLINQIFAGEYAQAMHDIESGKYPTLKNIIGEDGYVAFVNELEAASNGEPSVFDELKNAMASFDLQTLLNGNAGALNEMGINSVNIPENQISADQFENEEQVYNEDYIEQATE